MIVNTLSSLYSKHMLRQLAAAVVVLSALSVHTPVSAQERDALRVCADPNNLPFSNEGQEGYENKIAELFAQTLGLPLEYTWFPQRRGFIRHTLRSQDPVSGQFKCDLVMAVPVQFEMGLVTDPYYRSTWALVFRKDSPLGEIKTPDELFALPAETLAGLKIGVFDQTPGAIWLSSHGLLQQMVGYPTLNADPAEYPGRVIERDLHNKELDGAIVWGPIAGFFVWNEDENLALLPLRSGNGIRFDFAIAMAVRYGDKEWRDQVKGLIEQNKDAIDELLRSYHIPLVDENGDPL